MWQEVVCVVSKSIEFSTPNVAFLVFWLDHSTLVISSYPKSAYVLSDGS